MRKWSIFSRIGGKNKVREVISEFFPESYDNFVEVFAGGGQLLLHLLQNEYNPKVKYVINDKNKDIYNIWKNMKNVNINDLKSKDWRGSKSRFNLLKASKPKKAIDKLYRGLYLSWYSYGATNRTYADKKIVRGGHLWKIIEELQKKLKNVIVLNKDYIDVIKEYDSPTTLFYADPPYFNKEHLYEGQAVDPEQLVETLRNIKGKVVVSYNIVPEVSKAFKGFHFYRIKVPYSAGDVKEEKYEYIITNFAKTKGGRIQRILFEVDNNREMCKFLCKHNDDDTLDRVEKYLRLQRYIGGEITTTQFYPTEPKGVWCFWHSGDLTPIDLHGGASKATKFFRKVGRELKESVAQTKTTLQRVFKPVRRTDSPLGSIGSDPVAPYLTIGQESRSDGIYDVATISFYYKDNIAIGIGWEARPTDHNLGYHENDVEFVSIYYQNGKPVKVFMSEHSVGAGEGAWRNYNECEFRDGFLVVYVARNSHANYFTAGTQYRVYGVANDVTEATGPNRPYTWKEMNVSYDWTDGHGHSIYKGLRPMPPDRSMSQKERVLRF